MSLHLTDFFLTKKENTCTLLLHQIQAVFFITPPSGQYEPYNPTATQMIYAVLILLAPVLIIFLVLWFKGTIVFEKKRKPKPKHDQYEWLLELTAILFIIVLIVITASILDALGVK